MSCEHEKRIVESIKKTEEVTGMRKYMLNRTFVSMMALWAILIGFSPTNAFAFPTDSLSAIGSSSAKEAQIAQIMDVLSKPGAQLHLRFAGISDQEIRSALWKLDDMQLSQLAGRAETVKAGGNGVGLAIGI